MPDALNDKKEDTRGAAASDGRRPVLEVRQVSRSFARGTIRAVKDVSLSLYSGEVLSILGPSGCGKTTLMRMVAGLDRPESGSITIDGRDVVRVPAYKRDVGLVFQSLAVFPHMSVFENARFGLRMRKVPLREAIPRVERVLKTVQLDPKEFGARMPHELSGGQLQRVALARTLVTEPRVVLFDEPMAALDRRLRDYMAVELRSIQKKLNIAAIYVTHDQETASMMSDRIAIMNGGVIVQTGSPLEVYERPSTRFVASFLGEMNYFAGAIIGKEGLETIVQCGGFRIRSTDANAPTAGDATLGIRPEHLELLGSPQIDAFASGTITDQHFASGKFRYRIKIGNPEREVEAHCALSCPAGPTVWLKAAPNFVRFLHE